MGSIFSAEKVHLWMTDFDTGIFYTINKKGHIVRCLSGKGLISEVIKSGSSINCIPFFFIISSKF